MREFFVRTVKRASQTVGVIMLIPASLNQTVHFHLNVPAHDPGLGRQIQKSGLADLKSVRSQLRF